jgi:hypothetical protein
MAWTTVSEREVRRVEDMNEVQSGSRVVRGSWPPAGDSYTPGRTNSRLPPGAAQEWSSLRLRRSECLRGCGYGLTFSEGKLLFP